ncbi:MAG: hypothetical protein HYU29_02520 [Chloroflexi bacterium]|nr:hypothetical protein [Chloroflexota bacterium]
MNVFFDVDYTIISVDGSLRPGVKEVFQRLVNEGHRIYIWSGMGVRWREVRYHNLEPFVSGVYEKPLDVFDDALDRLGITEEPDAVIDDFPEIVEHYGGIVCRPYFFYNPHDTEMERIYDIIKTLSSNGRPDDPAFRPGRKRPGPG